jgi:uncharacterized protein YndB with AHSA1/START domain
VPSVRRELLLDAPPDRVWAFLTAPRFYPIWMGDVVLVQAVSTPVVAAGTTFVMARRGRHDQESWIVAEWEPPRHVRLVEFRRGTYLIFDLDARDASTRLQIEYGLPASRGLLGRMMPPVGLQRAVERMTERLTEIYTLNQDIKLLYGMGDE